MEKCHSSTTALPRSLRFNRNTDTFRTLDEFLEEYESSELETLYMEVFGEDKEIKGNELQNLDLENNLHKHRYKIHMSDERLGSCTYALLLFFKLLKKQFNIERVYFEVT